MGCFSTKHHKLYKDEQLNKQLFEENKPSTTSSQMHSVSNDTHVDSIISPTPRVHIISPTPRVHFENESISDIDTFLSQYNDDLEKRELCFNQSQFLKSACISSRPPTLNIPSSISDKILAPTFSSRPIKEEHSNLGSDSDCALELNDLESEILNYIQKVIDNDPPKMLMALFYNPCKYSGLLFAGSTTHCYTSVLEARLRTLEDFRCLDLLCGLLSVIVRALHNSPEFRAIAEKRFIPPSPSPLLCRALLERVLEDHSYTGSEVIVDVVRLAQCIRRARALDVAAFPERARRFDPQPFLDDVLSLSNATLQHLKFPLMRQSLLYQQQAPPLFVHYAEAYATAAETATASAPAHESNTRAPAECECVEFIEAMLRAIVPLGARHECDCTLLAKWLRLVGLCSHFMPRSFDRVRDWLLALLHLRQSPLRPGSYATGTITPTRPLLLLPLVSTLR